MSVNDVKPLAYEFFLARSDEFDLTTNEGCGQYIEAFVEEAQNKGFEKVGHLKKTGSATQYNGHANDTFLYREPIGEEGLYQAVDIIANAESKPPYTPSHQPPAAGWSVDIPRYKDSDWYLIEDNPIPIPTFPSYESLGGDFVARENLGKVLASDYKEANQQLNDGSVVWTFRTLYDAFDYILNQHMNSKDAIFKSIDKHRKEWRKELGLNP